MQNNHTYKIFTEYNLLIRYFQDNTAISDIYDNIISSLTDNSYHNNLKVLFDLRNAQLEINMEAMKNFANCIRIHSALQEKRYSVFLTTTPNQVAFSNILSSLRIHQRFQFRTVSTLQAAINFLDLKELSESEIEKIIFDIKDNPLISEAKVLTKPEYY